MRYRTIVADPPWPYTTPFRAGAATGKSTSVVLGPIVDRPLAYPTMSLEALSSLPVGTIADQHGARLFLWTTNNFLPDAIWIAERWGFQYRQVLVWDKRGGVPFVFPWKVAPNSAEFILVCTVGKPARIGKLPTAVLTAGVPKQHSRKPDVFIDWIEQVSPGPYVELFARRHRLGWDVWGDESANTATLTAMG